MNIWTDLRETDVAVKSSLNFETFDSVYKKHQSNLNNLLGVISSKELFELIDEDNVTLYT